MIIGIDHVQIMVPAAAVSAARALKHLSAKFMSVASCDCRKSQLTSVENNALNLEVLVVEYGVERQRSRGRKETGR
jgi:hypothetical protein